MAGKPLIQMADAVKTFLNFSTDRDKKNKNPKRNKTEKRRTTRMFPLFFKF